MHKFWAKRFFLNNFSNVYSFLLNYQEIIAVFHNLVFSKQTVAIFSTETRPNKNFSFFSAFNLVQKIVRDFLKWFSPSKLHAIKAKKRRADPITANFRSYFRNCSACASHSRLRLHLCTLNCSANRPQMNKSTRILFCGSSCDWERQNCTELHKTYRNKSY